MANYLFKKIVSICCFLIVLSLAMPGQAKVSKEEADQLKTTLTSLGAERQGNADGTIPPWDGGIKTIPPIGYNGPGSLYPDPYENDEVVLRITKDNLNQYSDKLSEGIKELFKRFPDTYYIDVYPTRRSMAAPEWMYENTHKNALTAEADENTMIITGAYGGVPFPIPKNGFEIVMNHLLRWLGHGIHYEHRGLIIDSSGRISPGEGGPVWFKLPYYDKNGTLENSNGYYMYMFSLMTAPPRKNGEVILALDPVNMAKSERKAWQYLTGQRRVRRAPSISYDTPNTTFGGHINYDDQYMFNGSPDRYNWKIIDKKEMYIPYNCYKVYLEPDLKKRFIANHPNPEYVRWELHRVWVVEGTLKEGSRHVYNKRRFIIDEDSWNIVLSDNYDAQGELWRSLVFHSKVSYDLPGISLGEVIGFEFQRGVYIVQTQTSQFGKDLNHEIIEDDSFFTPENIRRRGLR
ncbi:MAG: DUF1329 domain-containing protein [Desulfobacteraceae bacterium]|nr:MAG: DUF1329 domain-containing protein [Desulfobacteraceae bacterium]